MGMFDTIHCSYKPFGDIFQGDCQTNSLDCLMDDYWLSPAGELYKYDNSGAFDWEESSEKSESWIDMLGRFVPNGKHIKLVPQDYTGAINMVSDRSYLKDSEQRSSIIFFLVSGRVDPSLQWNSWGKTY
jgi:hypothetical protein